MKYCQAPGPGPGPFMVLAWSYPGLAPFLVKTGPGVDTIIKQTTTTPPPPHHKLFLSTCRLISASFGQTWARSRHYNQTDHHHPTTTPPQTFSKHLSPYFSQFWSNLGQE